MASILGIAVLVLAFFSAAAATAAQSELVLVKNENAEYHRPGCALVRDGRGVTAMTRAQAESRGLKAHTACDPAVSQSAREGAPTSSREKPPTPVYVFVSPGDNRYHVETCSKLGDERRRMVLDEAAKSHWPCRFCRPPIRKRSNPPAVPLRDRRD